MQTWEQQFELSPGGHLVVEQMAGPVQIQAWDQPRVYVKAVWKEAAGENRVQVRQRPGRLELEVLPAGRSFFRFSGDDGDPVFMQLMVPRQTTCQIETGSGAVSAEGLAAPLHVEAGSGSVRASRVAGGVRIETGSGPVEIEDCGGPVNIEVGSGNVTVRRSAGSIRVESGSGDLVLDQGEGPVALETGSGHVTVSGVRGPSLSIETGGGKVTAGHIDVRSLELESGSGSVGVELVAVHSGGRYRIESGSGSVTVAVPPDSDLSVDLQSPSGRVDYQNLNLREVRLEQGELTGILNRGGAKLMVEAGNGKILLQPTLHQPSDEEAAVAAGPAADGGLSAVAEEDPALAASDQLQRILRMVQEGKLTPDQAEEILRSLDEEAPA